MSHAAVSSRRSPIIAQRLFDHARLEESKSDPESPKSALRACFALPFVCGASISRLRLLCLLLLACFRRTGTVDKEGGCSVVVSDFLLPCFCHSRRMPNEIPKHRSFALCDEWKRGEPVAACLDASSRNTNAFRVTRVIVCRCLLFAIVCPISDRISANWRIFLFFASKFQFLRTFPQFSGRPRAFSLSRCRQIRAPRYQTPLNGMWKQKIIRNYGSGSPNGRHNTFDRL